jgi:prophage tail gpP-like protein
LYRKWKLIDIDSSFSAFKDSLDFFILLRAPTSDEKEKRGVEKMEKMKK